MTLLLHRLRKLLANSSCGIVALVITWFASTRVRCAGALWPRGATFGMN